MAPGGYRTLADLPLVIPVFPLPGALLLPRGSLPLNIFEPRYLNMVDDAMAGDRIIGMVQTVPGGERSRPTLANVGCLGRITSYAETADGRYLITLTGVCRFRVGPELSSATPYRQVRAVYGEFESDLVESDTPAGPASEAEDLMQALKAYLARKGLGLDWETAVKAPWTTLVDSLSMALPFDPAEKQALIEADAGEARRACLIALLRFDAAGGDEDDGPHRLQ